MKMTEKDELKNLRALFDLPKTPDSEWVAPETETVETETPLGKKLARLEKAKRHFMVGKTKHVYAAGKFSRWI